MIDLAVDMLWNNIHVGTGIICACLPTYRPLARASASFISSKISSLGSKGRSNASSELSSREAYVRFDSGHSKSENGTDVQKLSQTYLPLAHLQREMPTESSQCDPEWDIRVDVENRRVQIRRLSDVV